MRLRFALLAVSPFWVRRAARMRRVARSATRRLPLSVSAQRSLDFGILVLLTPALILFLAVMFMLYRRAIAATA